jgi:hypothetical protein
MNLNYQIRQTLVLNVVLGIPGLKLKQKNIKVMNVIDHRQKKVIIKKSKIPLKSISCSLRLILNSSYIGLVAEIPNH